MPSRVRPSYVTSGSQAPALGRCLIVSYQRVRCVQAGSSGKSDWAIKSMPTIRLMSASEKFSVSHSECWRCASNRLRRASEHAAGLLHHLGILFHSARRKIRAGVQKASRALENHPQFCPPFPGADQGPAEGVVAQQRGCGVEFFEILDDRQGFRDDRAVVKFEDRDGAERIALQKLRAALLAAQQVNRPQRQLNAFFGTIDTHLAAVRRQ